MMSDDDLGIIYLINKKTEFMNSLYNTVFEESFLLENDIILLRSKNNNDSSFRILDLSIKKKENEPFDEIFVNPETTNILFFKNYLGNISLKIKVRYDNIEKNWDVRYIDNDKEILSNLKESIDNLGDDSFVKIINACMNVFNLSKEKKLTK